MAGMGVHRPVLNRQSGRCTNDSPPWFTGRWRDWHRGHGCDKDDGQPRTIEGALEIQHGERVVLNSVAAQQLLDLERDLRESLRGGYLFGNFDEPLDAAGLRIVRVIQQRLSDLPCGCTDRTPDGARCRACGGMLPPSADAVDPHADSNTGTRSTRENAS